MIRGIRPQMSLLPRRARITLGESSACCSSLDDPMSLQLFELFGAEEQYYSAVFHELTLSLAAVSIKNHRSFVLVTSAAGEAVDFLR
jgi:hypothetical protein